MKKDLSEYARKRDFTQSPEPRGSTPAAPDSETTFVVHRHEATRLHYDFRLRADGVLD